jgi:predicted RNA binding protein YcfA (HicA-like mRNA interferase family)
MKLKDLVRHLEGQNCRFVRHGGNHTIYKNLDNGKLTLIPRHRDIKENLARKICDDLGIKRVN